MAIEYDKTGKLFQVDYQAPFGGIDSTAYASAINPANFAAMDSVYLEDNQLLPIFLEPYVTSGIITGNYLGFIPFSLAANGRPGYVITDNGVYEVDITGPNTINVGIIAAYTPAELGFSGNIFSYLVIDQIQTGIPQIFWTAGGWNEIWTFNGSAATLLTNYVGGGILGLLNNQLLNLGGFSQADGSVPNRISWSAPGQYGQFQPYDIPSATGNYSAGFNDLPSTSDVLIGFAAIGTVGYLFRNEGITQVNPTGNGIEPFAFNHLWASELGIGSPYPGSISQYGAIVAFITDSGVYTLGLTGLSLIGVQAQSYIFKQLNSQFSLVPSGFTEQPQYQLQSRLIPYILDSPDLIYIIGYIVPEGGNGGVQFTAIDISSGNTYNFGQQIVLPGAIKGFAVSYLKTSILTNNPSSQVVPFVVIGNPPTSNPQAVFYRFTTSNIKVGFLTFRKEQMKFGYIPTVTKIGFLAALIDITQGGSITINIDGTSGFGGPFPPIQIQPGVGNPGNGIYDNVYSDAVQSLERPQLSINLQNVKIAQAWYQGTLADFPLI